MQCFTGSSLLRAWPDTNQGGWREPAFFSLAHHRQNCASPIAASQPMKVLGYTVPIGRPPARQVRSIAERGYQKVRTDRRLMQQLYLRKSGKECQRVVSFNRPKCR